MTSPGRCKTAPTIFDEAVRPVCAGGEARRNPDRRGSGLKFMRCRNVARFDACALAGTVDAF